MHLRCVANMYTTSQIYLQHANKLLKFWLIFISLDYSREKDEIFGAWTAEGGVSGRVLEMERSLVSDQRSSNSNVCRFKLDGSNSRRSSTVVTRHIHPLLPSFFTTSTMPLPNTTCTPPPLCCCQHRQHCAHFHPLLWLIPDTRYQT